MNSKPAKPTNPTPLNPDALSDTARVALINSARELGQEHWCLSVPAQAKRVLNECADALAVAQPEVNSVEELDQLPIGSLIMMSGVVAPFLHTDDGWESTRTPGKPVWDYTTNPSYLPARVLYRPTKESTNGR